MGFSSHDPRRVQTHRTYTANELAGRFDVHIQTIRNWQRAGLLPIDSRKPALFLGLTVATFVRGRAAGNKRPCAPDELYCMRCGQGRVPVGRLVAEISFGPNRRCLRGSCPDCCASMYRWVGNATRSCELSGLSLSSAEGEAHISQYENLLADCQLQGQSRV